MNSELSRRQMLLMSALAAAAFSPLGRALGAPATAATGVDAGDVSVYAKDGIYDQFAGQGFFIIRRDGKVVAQSSMCTHKRGRLVPAQDGFTCPLHHSAFTLDGKVTRPPARTDLVRYAVSRNDSGHLIVDLSKRIERTQFDTAGAYVESPSA